MEEIKYTRIKNKRVLVTGGAGFIDYGVNVTIYDPWVNTEEVMHEYGLEVMTALPQTKFDGIVHAVSHNEFKKLDFTQLKKPNSILFDVKGTLEVEVDGKL